MSLRKVAVAILSWNGRHHLEVCLPSLATQHDPGVEWDVWVLDNGSRDGTVDWLRENHPDVKVIASPVNLGFCGGVNRLVEAAEDADAVALLNNDTRAQPGWLAALVDGLASAPDDVAAVSGLIVDWQGDRLDFGRGIMTFDGHAFQKDFRQPLDTVEIPAAGDELLFACGGNMLIRRQSFLDAGGFDNAYFAYLEDVDLGWRLWSGGERVIFSPDAVVHHRSMATSALLGNDHRGFLFERNAFLTAYKNYDAELWPAMMPAVQLTLGHRTQTLLVQNNPGGEQLTFDPYAGLIADTAPVVIDEPASSSAAAPAGAAPAVQNPSLWRKFRDHGAREMARRGVRKAARKILPGFVFDAPNHAPTVADGRTVAQFRALTWLYGHLDPADAERRRIQARRTVPDREIFARFPLYLIPTYPGDRRLFGSEAFTRWLPAEPRLERARLDEIMAE
ncbi:MAG: glycosyltransferase family 2 protein [Acidobacteriota bacterium]